MDALMSFANDMGQWSCSSASISPIPPPHSTSIDGQMKNRGPCAVTAPSHSTAAKLGRCWDGLSWIPALLTSWIKQHWWEMSSMSPCRHHTTLSLAGIWVGFVPSCWASRGAGLGVGRSSICYLQRHVCDCHLPRRAKRKWAVFQTTGGFPLGTLLQLFFSSPRFQVQLQT